MINILLLSSGTNACYQFAKIIKEKFPSKFVITGVDINQEYLIPTSPYLDYFEKVPYSNDPTYYNRILRICEKYKIHYLLPSLDVDQLFFYPENEDLRNLGIISLGTSLDTLPAYKNKKLMLDYLNSQGLPTPISYDVNSLVSSQEYFIKPIHGFGSIGAQKAKATDIKKMPDLNDYLIQEVCNQPEYTVECFYYKNTIYSVARERIATKAGVCTKAKVFHDPNLEEIACKFANGIKTPYFFNMQFMRNISDQFVITDVNLRLAGGMGLSYAAGWDEISALANIMLERPDHEVISSLKLSHDVQYVVRAYTDIVTKCS